VIVNDSSSVAASDAGGGKDIMNEETPVSNEQPLVSLPSIADGPITQLMIYFGTGEPPQFLRDFVHEVPSLVERLKLIPIKPPPPETQCLILLHFMTRDGLLPDYSFPAPTFPRSPARSAAKRRQMINKTLRHWRKARDEHRRLVSLRNREICEAIATLSVEPEMSCREKMRILKERFGPVKNDK
jgi:hypothetical protein